MGSGFDIKDGEIELRINSKVYSLEQVYSTAYVYLDKYYFLFDGDKDQEIILKIKPKTEGADLQKFAQDFLNELISISNYFNQFEKNKDIINAVLQRALFSASPKLVEQAEEQEINKILEEVEKDVNL